jgi:hypothetical protein
MKDRYIALPAYVSPEGKINLKGSPASGLKANKTEATDWAIDQLSNGQASGINTFYIAEVTSLIERAPHPIAVKNLDEAKAA